MDFSGFMEEEKRFSDIFIKIKKWKPFSHLEGIILKRKWIYTQWKGVILMGSISLKRCKTVGERMIPQNAMGIRLWGYRWDLNPPTFKVGRCTIYVRHNYSFAEFVCGKRNKFAFIYISK